MSDFPALYISLPFVGFVVILSLMIFCICIFRRRQLAQLRIISQQAAVQPYAYGTQTGVNYGPMPQQAYPNPQNNYPQYPTSSVPLPQGYSHGPQNVSHDNLQLPLKEQPSISNDPPPYSAAVPTAPSASTSDNENSKV